MSIGVHCDNPTCETWSFPSMAIDAGFVTVIWFEKTLHFCSWDCTIMYGAQIEPITKL